ncbi:hypothetical protein CVO77_02915 [Sphingopyxis lindanitolerans]|uniref:Uncharacterized protein n=1 Tax=Sphingopyxis lindanitolerans TaxID=2054227 RepID=A0A2S8B574_9SPHN|nr:hypothetical protein [Sphingopyxis lindanitolerans]PQM27552.1 hypothetical protein CVO77_02915 [Sphingopyxis lindanitolerans]
MDELRSLAIYIVPLMLMIVALPTMTVISARRTGELKIPRRGRQQFVLRRSEDTARFDAELGFLQKVTVAIGLFFMATLVWIFSR